MFTQCLCVNSHATLIKRGENTPLSPVLGSQNCNRKTKVQTVKNKQTKLSLYLKLLLKCFLVEALFYNYLGLSSCR